MIQLLFERKSQIWVETVIYTLIGLTLIAIVLSIATPYLQTVKDKAVISQTVDALLVLHKELLVVADVVGNVRIVQFKILKGGITINELNDTIQYVLENTNAKYSEPGVPVTEGDLVYLTEPYARRYTIFVTIPFTNFDIINENEQAITLLPAGGVLYKIKIENEGFNETSGKIMIRVGTI